MNSCTNLKSIHDAAVELNIPPGTLRRFCREGMPHIPGRRGRAHATLVDVEKVRQWMGAPCDEQRYLELASVLPRILALAVEETWRTAEVFNKRSLAGFTCALWYSTATATLDYMRSVNPEIPDVKNKPPEIKYLQKIAQGN